MRPNTKDTSENAIPGAEKEYSDKNLELAERCFADYNAVSILLVKGKAGQE
jgi:hypothetical protein